ncbi:hypothetical protein XaFJ1_GM000680 [Xanthomonas albilineans]|nr:hypothetical protein XaFJ1_GM000680 [Xanthomonas albilineans]
MTRIFWLYIVIEEDLHCFDSRMDLCLGIVRSGVTDYLALLYYQNMI